MPFDILSPPEGDTKQARSMGALKTSHVVGGSLTEVTSGFQTAPRNEMLFGIHSNRGDRTLRAGWRQGPNHNIWCRRFRHTH